MAASCISPIHALHLRQRLIVEHPARPDALWWLEEKEEEDESEAAAESSDDSRLSLLLANFGIAAAAATASSLFDERGNVGGAGEPVDSAFDAVAVGEAEPGVELAAAVAEFVDHVCGAVADNGERLFRVLDEPQVASAEAELVGEAAAGAGPCAADGPVPSLSSSRPASSAPRRLATTPTMSSSSSSSSSSSPHSRPPFPHAEAFTLYQPPHPTWQAGGSSASSPPPQLPPPAELGDADESLDPARLAAGGMYHLLISAVVPRPIALVSSIDADSGRVNVAPYSYFNIVCHDPPTLMISMNHQRGGQPKDSLLNAQATGEFVVNMVSEHMVESANHTSCAYPHGVEEHARAGMRLAASERVRPPRVRDAALAFECRLQHVYTVHHDDDGGGAPSAAASVVLGRIVNVVAKRDVLVRSDDGKVTVDPRSGYELPRPTYDPAAAAGASSRN
ncbi:hypothetical protein DFJ73DRAFT_778039 [Zopfochytrium polystomum]|nr:hypothetical protein DFJ73DRAFT_778039 [Zopfochytrium polystomum]